MGDVTVLSTETTLDIPVERVCEQAKELETSIIVGIKDGEFQLRSSQGDMGEVALHLLAAQKLVAESI